MSHHLSLSFLLLAIVLASGCLDANSSECTTDMDCKGARICSAESGACVDPTESSQGTGSEGEGGQSSPESLELSVSFDDCYERCTAVARACGAPGELAEDICGYELCRERALTYDEATCLENSSCAELEQAITGSSDTICGVTLSTNSPMQTPASQPPASTPSGASTCKNPGADCTTGSDCKGYDCICDGERQLGSLFSCKLKTGFLIDGASCPSGADVCKPGAGCPSDTRRASWEDAGCWGD